MSKRRKARSTSAVVAWAVLATAASVGLGVLIVGPTSANADPLGTSLTNVDTTVLAVARESFCDKVPAGAVQAALAESHVTLASYAPGDTATVADNVRDLADEYSCRWTSDSSAAGASAWVFAPAVTVVDAKSFTSDIPEGCLTTAAPDFGEPTQTLQCGNTVWLRGLFGDAWLNCTVTGADLDRAGRFCAVVAKAASS